MPFDPVLTLETAILLLVCFLVGATVGSLLHAAILRRQGAPAAAAPALGTPPSQAEALVAAPVIAPLSIPPEPTVPAEVPVPDFGFATPAEERVEIAPARKPGRATSGRDVGRPDKPVAGKAPEPSATIEALEVAIAADAVEEPAPTMDEAPAAPPEQMGDTTVAERADDSSQEAAAAAPGVDVTAELLALAPAGLGSGAPAEPASIRPDQDEFAAMRAIEGNWTPRRRQPRPKPMDEPPPQPLEPPGTELAQAKAASAAPAPMPEPQPVPVVIVAEDDEGSVAETESQPVAEVPPIVPPDEDDRIVPADDAEAGLPTPERVELEVVVPVADALDQPQGIGAPRYGMRDDLTQIVGVLPVVETALNRIGVYHFDQVAEWSDANAAWVEAHLGIGGRVDREHWREQARELAAIATGGRPSRKRRPS